MKSMLAHLSGIVVSGYKRGSKELGFPTANLNVTTNLDDGVYCGWAQVVGIDEEKRIMVMSVGSNPHYGNTVRSVEVHILQVYENDFYGTTVDVEVAHYIRDMQKFSSTEDLIDAIRQDISAARLLLAKV